MGPVWLLLLLLPSLLRAQVTSNFTTDVKLEADNTTDSLTNSTGAPDISTSASTSIQSPEPSGFAATPSQAPTEEEDDWSPAETFMYTGEPSTLEAARCSRAYSPPGQTGSLPISFSAPLRPSLDALANTANFLNMIFQASDLRESTVEEDMEWYHALVRALLEADVLIQRSLLTFDADPSAPVPQLVLRASRNPKAKVQTIILQDLSKAWESLHPPAPAPDDSWFRRFKFPEANQPMAALSKRVLLNDLTTLDTPKWRQGDSYVTNRSGVCWASAPFLDCTDGHFTPGWMLTLSTSFYGLKPDLTPEFRGVIRVDVNIQDIDLDQCASGDSWFADTHQCNRTTMECIPIPGRGFRLGQYCCRCKEGYYNPEIAPQDSGVDADGGPANRSDGGSMCYPNMPICLPCWPGCKSCQDGTPCWVQEAWLLRAGVLAVQGVFMFLIFVSMLVAYRHRRNRRIRASGLLLLETILFGSLLLYFPCGIRTFTLFTTEYMFYASQGTKATSVDKAHLRVLKVFLSRTAQRVPYMSSLHLLRILGVMLMTVSWFLCAWTVGVLQNRDRNIPVFITTTTSEGQGFNLCYLDRWDYMMAVAELLFLCWGSSLWTAVRPVPSAFHEPRYMGIAIHNELLLSTMFHLFRFTFPSLHPDWMLLLSFTHTHVTITVTLALLFIPKFLYVSKPGREEIAAEVYEDEVDLRRSGSYLNSSFHSVWSEPSVDPDDFRDELKKLYAQLEVHKTKKMTANNPHLSKKRSSRCALGRSIIRRIAEIPESMSRQCSREEKDGSFHSRSVNQSESFRRGPDTISVSISYRSSIKTPSPSMRKSQSDHHYVRERDSSLHDSMLKNNVKRSSRRSETDSLDIPPGVCKSASAQNLTIDTNLLHPDHTRLHKSWSLTSATAHSMENIPKVNRASTVLSRSRQSISISDQTKSALQSESFDKTEVCPWEVEPEQSGDKNQKHVTYANSEDAEENAPPSPQVLICPWDHIPSIEKTPSEDKGIHSEAPSPKPQAPVSASAPGSPRPKVTKDQRVFSFRTSTNVCPWEGPGTFQEGEGPKKQQSIKADICPWDSQVSEPSNICPWESQEQMNMRRRGSAISNVCPWESQEQMSMRRRGSAISNACPWESQDIPTIYHTNTSRDSQTQSLKRATDVCPWETAETSKPSIRQDNEYANICPWVVQDKDVVYENLNPLETKGSLTVPHRQEAGKPANYSGASKESLSNEQQYRAKSPALNLGRQMTKTSESCPWDFPDPPKIMENICPWEEVKTDPTNTESSSQMTIKVDICPWETGQNKPEDSQNDVSPLKAATIQTEGKDSARVNICPWETEPLEKRGDDAVTKMVPQGLEKLADVCPWDSSEPESGNQETSKILESHVRQDTVHANVCPWDTEEPKVLKKQDSARADVCPWETEEPKVLKKQDSARADVCPWDTEEPKVLKKQDSARADVCPWDTEEPKVLKKQDSARADVCPWDTEEPKVLKKQDSARADVCPWETDDPNVLTKQDTARADVCPWDTDDPKVLTKQDSARADVCPWDTEDPKVLTKQDTARADVCPWDTEDPKVLAKQDTARADVCPWDTEDPKVLTKQDTARADVCPWDTEDPKVLAKQDTARADACPWDTDDPKVPTKQDTAQADVCPWDTEDPKVLTKQDTAQADVCPWDSQDPQTLTESKFEIPTSDKVEVTENPEPLTVEETPADIRTEQINESKENLALGRRDALCPWEMARNNSGSFTDNTSDVFTWEPENIPEEDEEDDAECAAEALVFPPDL
ncbi:hypothetical protein GBF38_003044 [Nibea albiflora]|uniref:Uncharacterized protein n=1 Tax=Nibea albiflora TaxID=240163 RepID=A0ACB7FJE8_NIBAL|nr:hypothetical protein GBF38_003044 [Nibea albiflora]